MTPQRGQVWEYVAGSRQYRVAIISNDDFNSNTDTQPVALAIAAAYAGPPGYAIPMTPEDPVTHGAVEIAHFMRLTRTGLVRLLGHLSEDTYRQVEQELRDLLELP